MSRAEAVEQTQQLLTQQLEMSGKLGILRAQLAEASLSILNEQDTDMFAPVKKLRDAKASEGGMIQLSLVHNFLKNMGLLYTANVFAMECSIPGSKFHGQDALQKKLNVSAVEEESVLSTLLASGGTDVKLAIATSPEKSEAEESPSKKKSGGPTKEGVHAAVEAILQKDKARSPEKSTKSPEKGGVKETAKKVGKDTTYYISDWIGPKEFVRVDQVQGQNVAIEELEDCKILILDAVDSINMDACKNCELIVAACEGSIFIRECENVRATVACKQLRLRDCSFCPINLYSHTDPVVEMSHHIDFRPFNLSLPHLAQRFKEARLDPGMNRFVHVYDFTEDDTSLPQPHFTVHFPNHGLKLQDAAEKYGKPECPSEIRLLLEGKLDPAASCEQGKNKSQNIKTGAKSWQASANPTGVTTGKPPVSGGGGPTGLGPTGAPKTATTTPTPAENLPSPKAVAKEEEKPDPNILKKDEYSDEDEKYDSFEDDDDEF